MKGDQPTSQLLQSRILQLSDNVTTLRPVAGLEVAQQGLVGSAKCRSKNPALLGLASENPQRQAVQMRGGPL